MLLKKITVNGLVQGVGFRLFVYSIAREQKILGEVYNSGRDVVIITQCLVQQLENLLAHLQKKPPKLARVTKVKVEDYQTDKTYTSFNITFSK